MIKITLQKTLSALIISGFALASQTVLAYDPCQGSSTSDMFECATKGVESAKKQTKQAINAQKNKIPQNRFEQLQRSQQAWESATVAYCDYNARDGGSMDRLNYASCIAYAWKKRAKNVKADAKAFKANRISLTDEQEAKVENSYTAEEQKLNKKVQNVLKQIDKNTDEYNRNLMREKRKAYQKHISAWKDFAFNYCFYQGNDYVCLNSLYKAKNKLVQKDLDWFSKSEEERLLN